jgi:hypothetical protein
MVAIVIAAVALIVIFWLIPNSNNRAATSALNNAPINADQLRVSGVRLSQQDVAGAANVDVYGQATNTSNRPVSQAVVSGTFKDKTGAIVYVEQEPIERVEVSNSKDKDVNAKPLTDQPIGAGKTVDFRVRFSQVPATWNHKAPEVTVSRVTEQK